MVGGGKTKEDQEDGGKERKKIICRNKWFLLNNFELFKLLIPTVHVIESTQPLSTVCLTPHNMKKKKGGSFKKQSPKPYD